MILQVKTGPIVLNLIHFHLGAMARAHLEAVQMKYAYKNIVLTGNE